MKLTIRDIAKLSGVSITTVSKIINNKDESISEKTRNRVKQIMAEHDYEPSSIAQSLVTKKTKSLGVVIPDIRNPFFPEMIRGAEDMAHEKGYSLIICNTDDDESKEVTYLNALKKNFVDGIIFAASSIKSSTIDKLLKGSLPIINIDRRVDLHNITSKIFVHNDQGGYMATEHLIRKGCKAIAFISGAETSPSSNDRYKGFLKAMADNEMPVDTERCYFGKFNSDFGYETTRRLLQSGKVDGIFCASDLIALGAMRAVMEAGLRIPEDVKVIGFDDIYVAKYFNPPLTTIRQPIYQIGYQASRELIDSIESKDKFTELRQIMLEVELIERSST